MRDSFILLEEAKVLFQLGRYKDAEKKLYEALAIDSLNIAVLILLCQCKFTLGKTNEGIAIAQSVVGMDPENATGFVLMAEGAARSGNPVEAELNMRFALQLDSQNADYMAILSGYLLLQRDEPAAVQMAVNALKINPQNVTALAALGRAKSELEDFEEALNAFHQGLAIDPNNAILLQHIGMTLKEAGAATSAKAMFLDALRNDPNLSVAALGVAGVSFSHNPVYRWHYYLVGLFKQSHVTRLMFFAGAFLFLLALAHAAREDFPAFSKVLAVGSWGFLLILLSVFIVPSAGNLPVVFKEQYSQVFTWQAKIKSVSITLLYLLSISLLVASLCLSQSDESYLLYYSFCALIATLLTHVLLGGSISAMGRLIAFLAAAILFGTVYLVASDRVSFERFGSLYLYMFAASMTGTILHPFRKLQD